MDSEDIEELKERNLCAICIEEDYLRNIIEKKGNEDVCHYCGNTRPIASLEEMTEQIGTAFSSHYKRTPNEPNDYQYMMIKDRELEYDWERDGEPSVYAIMNAANIPENAASDIQLILADEHYYFDKSTIGEETEFSSEAHYEESLPSDKEWQESWQNFERTIKSEARFFNQEAATQLKNLFDQVNEMQTFQGRSLIVDAGPDTNYTHLYRARVFQSDQKLKQALIRPDRELGAPPSPLASPGRMNAHGISVFYGATAVEIAIAEVRPPVGSQVAVARFDIIRPIRLLDLTTLEEAYEEGSIFDPDYAYRLSRIMFLRSLCARMARPIMPDDQESEYLPTQAVADFLATEGLTSLDGILFPSAQVNNSGLNAVLFHKAARCTEIEFPKNTEFSASTYINYEEGSEPNYRVTENVPPEEDTQKETDPFDLLQTPNLDWANLDDFDDREVTISVDIDSFQVHIVNAVQIETSSFQVTRHRWTKTKMPF